MQSTSVEENFDNSFPFSREIFEDRTIVFHGSWSTSSPRIETEGLLTGNLALDLKPIVAITTALKAIGCGSFFSAFGEGNYAQPFSAREVFFTPSFWGARAYATDAGGEVVRTAIKDASDFEHISSAPEGLMNRYKEALKGSPNHAPTQAALACLGDKDRMTALLTSVRAAKDQLIGLASRGYPVVYAVRVEPEWFGDSWERYLYRWQKMGKAGGELKCRGVPIPPERLVARADYPNGTDSIFSPFHITQWHEIEEMIANG
jgi:hypothetical protein